MRETNTACLAAALLLGLSGCSETSSGGSTAAPAASLRTGSAADESACEVAVRRETNNPDVVILDSDFSQAATEVIIGVGPQRARWRCLVSGGRVSDVTSLTDEGAL